MLRRPKPLPKDIADRIASLTKDAHQSSDPDFDNKRMLEFLESEQSAGDGPWWERSPWAPSCERDAYLADSITLYHWHFRETANPVFVFLAYTAAIHLGEQYSNLVSWVYDYLAEKALNIAELIQRPPKGNQSDNFAKVFGLENRQNENPFREAGSRLRYDQLYIQVRYLVEAEGCRVTRAIETVGNRLGISEPVARREFYTRRRLVERDRAPNAAKVAAALFRH